MHWIFYDDLLMNQIESIQSEVRYSKDGISDLDDHQIPLNQHLIWLVVWTALKKIWKSTGMMKFQIYGKII